MPIPPDKSCVFCGNEMQEKDSYCDECGMDTE